jgi:hypothetical protein
LEFYQAERTNYKEQLGQATLNISINEWIIIFCIVPYMHFHKGEG